MGSKVTGEDVRGHLLSLEKLRPRMAKVNLKEIETVEKTAYGRVIARAIQIAGLSKKEAADVLAVDEGQLGRWISGKETPQTWRFRAVPQLRRALLFAEADDNEEVVVQTTLIVRSA